MNLTIKEIRDNLKHEALQKGNGKILNCLNCNKLFNKNLLRKNRQRFYCDRTCLKNHYESIRLNQKQIMRHCDNAVINITHGEYIELRYNATNCDICNKKLNIDVNPKDINVDHCHNTNKFRGILCRRCNGYLGMIEKNKLAYDNYLKGIKAYENNL